MTKPDFYFSDQGSICILTPDSEAARDWVSEHLPSDAMNWGGGTVIEHRFAGDILKGIIAEGLTIENS